MATWDFTDAEAKEIGDKLGISWLDYDLDQFKRGLGVEMEHGSMLGEETNITHDNLLTTGRIVWAHLKEHRDYYTRLARLEAEDQAGPAGPTGIDQLGGSSGESGHL